MQPTMKRRRRPGRARRAGGGSLGCGTRSWPLLVELDAGHHGPNQQPLPVPIELVEPSAYLFRKAGALTGEGTKRDAFAQIRLRLGQAPFRLCDARAQAVGQRGRTDIGASMRS